MGEADQFIKRMFREETERATHEVVHFENAPEIATPSLTPDGVSPGRFRASRWWRRSSMPSPQPT